MKIEKICFNGPKQKYMESETDLEHSFKNKDTINVIYEKNGEIVAYMVVGPESAYFEKGNNETCFIESWAVLPEHQKSGIGKEMLKECEKLSKEAGFKTISANFIECIPKGYTLIKPEENIYAKTL